MQDFDEDAAQDSQPDQEFHQDLPENAPSDRMYQPGPHEAQLTLRAVLVGCLVGGVVACSNVYIGLKIGWGFGASIISAVLGYSFFALINQKLSVMETNIAQTSGSAAGYMSTGAGLVSAIPALAMLGYEFEWWAMLAWALSVGFLGVFFAVPLRKQVVEIDRLRFPTGTATAETIMAMFGDAAEAMAKSRVLLACGLFAGAYKLGVHYLPVLESPPIHEWSVIEALGLAGVLGTAAAWTFSVYLGPSLLGAGFLIGPRVVLSLVAGAIIAWGVLGPIAQQEGWAPGAVMSYAEGPRGWLLWPGVALMVSESLAALAFSWRTFLNAFSMLSHTELEDGGDGNNQTIPPSWWISGLVLGSLLTIGITSTIFEIKWWLVVVAIPLSAILAVVAVRSVGETDINPVGGMGKVTQLVFGGLAPNSMNTNLLCAAITGAGASQAGDMMNDLKTGHLLGASPRKQLVAQLSGICAGIVFGLPVYYLFAQAYEFGGKEMPAPAAMAWKAMAEVLADGFAALPPMSTQAVVIAGLAGITIAALRQLPNIKAYVPSGLAMGIAFIIPAFYSLVMFYGLVIWLVWRLIHPTSVEKYTFAVASGLIAGEGLMGVVTAGLTILGV